MPVDIVVNNRILSVWVGDTFFDANLVGPSDYQTRCKHDLHIARSPTMVMEAGAEDRVEHDVREALMSQEPACQL